MRQKYSFLLSRTWIAWFLICAAFAVACVFLGQWQMDRRELSLAEINRVVANYDEDPVPYVTVSDLFTSPTDEDEWTVVQARGEYLWDDALLVRNRSHGGSIGYEQLVPFQIARTNDVVVISRGWLPTDSADGSQPAFMPAPSSGDISVVFRLRPGEPEINRDAPDGQLPSIDLDEYQESVGYELQQGAYGLMAEESPAAEVSPRALARPDMDEGPHLSYSMQWIAFGLLGFVGLGYAARVQARNNELDRHESYEHEPTRHRAAGNVASQRLQEAKKADRIRRGQLSDEDIEDAWVDQQIKK